jgi:hypothetical protein
LIENQRLNLVEIAPKQSKELLHMEEEGKEVQLTKQQHQQEESEHQEEDQKTNNSIF